MGKEPVPDLLVEQLLLGELPPERSKELLADPEVRERLRRLESSNREILQAYPVEVMAKRIGWRLEKTAEAPVRRPLARLLPAVGLAGLLVTAGLTIVLASIHMGRPETTLEVTRLKGLKPRLAIYRQSGLEAEALQAEGSVRTGDLLQIGYLAAGRPFGVIFSIDGRGTLTLHFPHSASASNRLKPDGEVLLDYAYKLDDAPEFERFFLVTAQRAFPVQAVLQAARELAAEPQRARREDLVLPRGLDQWSLLLLKE